MIRASTGCPHFPAGEGVSNAYLGALAVKAECQVRRLRTHSLGRLTAGCSKAEFARSAWMTSGAYLFWQVGPIPMAALAGSVRGCPHFAQSPRTSPERGRGRALNLARTRMFRSRSRRSAES